MYEIVKSAWKCAKKKRNHPGTFQKSCEKHAEDSVIKLQSSWGVKYPSQSRFQSSGCYTFCIWWWFPSNWVGWRHLNVGVLSESPSSLICLIRLKQLGDVPLGMHWSQNWTPKGVQWTTPPQRMRWQWTQKQQHKQQKMQSSSRKCSNEEAAAAAR